MDVEARREPLLASDTDRTAARHPYCRARVQCCWRHIDRRCGGLEFRRARRLSAQSGRIHSERAAGGEEWEAEEAVVADVAAGHA